MVAVYVLAKFHKGTSTYGHCIIVFCQKFKMTVAYFFGPPCILLTLLVLYAIAMPISFDANKLSRSFIEVLS